MNTRKMIRTLLSIVSTTALLIFLVLSLAACKGSGSSGKGGSGGYERTGSEPATGTSATSAVKNDGRVADANDEPKKNVVSVHLSEYAIGMPAALKPGLVTFRVSNEGNKDHSFEIQGEGIDKKLSDNLAAGETSSLQVDLKPGKYRVTCPLFGHAMLGMSMDVTVGS